MNGEIKQTSYFWAGTREELSAVVKNELGIEADPTVGIAEPVPAEATYLQLTSFFNEDDEAVDKELPNALVMFYDAHMRPIDGASFTL